MAAKIAVTGVGGQLGSELARQLGHDCLPLDRRACDLTDPLAVGRALNHMRPRAVINAAAYTKVDLAEKEVDLCRLVNATAVGRLAEVCGQLDCPLLQVSTDYVFDGYPPRNTPLTENDPPQAKGIYASTKLAGELAARSNPRHFVVRTCGLYGRLAPDAKSGNFVETMLRLGRERGHVRVVDDQHCTPSYVPHVARAIRFLIGTEAYGTYHVVNAGATTWHDFAAEIFRLAGMQVRLERITTAEFGAAAPRPAYSVLDTAKYHSLGGPKMPNWREALREYLCERLASPSR
jgi:dTDP-4-dehydrorhamnose reductase